ncbi:MAG: BCD family MFS transporter [Betaproteobacteria bacterium]|nr:BCD family MFS transporter [Betaproteobacteria bacterium]
MKAAQSGLAPLVALNRRLALQLRHISPRFLPFADAAGAHLPLGQMLRLSLFQCSVGMCLVLLTGTLNRVMIVEMGVAAWLVALMVSLPIVFAPLRAFIGFRSDTHRSAIGWRRVPYLWFGTLLQVGGLEFMPFALIVLAGDAQGPAFVGPLAAAVAFLMVGAGLHTTQTAGLALAADLADEDKQPRVVALLYVMLLAGMLLSALIFAWVLADYSPMQLIRVVQGAAVATMVFNAVALWKQEPRNPNRRSAGVQPAFRPAWRSFVAKPGARRFLWATALGTAAFNMQDILLEPYGAEVLRLPVAHTTALTAFTAMGMLIAFAWAARELARGRQAIRLAATGAVIGVFAFAAVIFAGALGSADLFRAGASLIGLGGGLFAVGTLTTAMNLEQGTYRGLALGAWGAVQATAAGVAIASGGALRDLLQEPMLSGAWGEALQKTDMPYSFVYHLEIALLFATLVALGPVVRLLRQSADRPARATGFGLAQLPG